MGAPAEQEAEQGGIVKTTTLHYAGLGAIIPSHYASWASGDIHPAEDLSEKVPLTEYDPNIHTINAPESADHTVEDPIMADNGNINVSMVVDITPDRFSKEQTALVTAELLNPGTRKMETLKNQDQTIVYHQVTMGEVSDINPSTHSAGTAASFSHTHSWADTDGNISTSSVGLHLGTKLHELYNLNTVGGTVANAVTYILDAPVSADEATRIASGAGTAGTDYRYSVRQPIVMLTTPTGVEDITITVPATSEYYTLQGIKLSERPTLPGMYIQKSGSNARTILIKQ